MRRRIVTTVGLSAVAAVLVFNFRIRDPFPPVAAVETTPVVTTVAPTSTTETDPDAPTTTAAPNYPILPTRTSTTLAPLPTSPDARAVNGPEVDTRFGPMQVQIIVADGVIEEVIALELPEATGTSRLISRIYWPIFRNGTVEQQSAEFDFGSGATVTWDAYVESLESAMEIAGML
jgi:uncharacterized protein with FMN-binding domain